MDRNLASDAAFACILDIRGMKYKLARHHNLNTVRDGLEHDTVDPKLLSLSLLTLDQLPIGEEERAEIRKHLKQHEAAIASDPQPNDLKSNDVNRETVEGDEEKARKIVGEQSGAVDGNDSLKNPKTAMTMEPRQSVVVNQEGGATVAQLVQPGNGSITSPKSTPTKLGVKDTDAGRPKGDQQDTKLLPSPTDVESKDKKSTPASPPKVSEGPVDGTTPGVETDGGEVVEVNPAINDPATVPVSKGNLHDPEEDIKEDMGIKGGKKTKKVAKENVDLESEVDVKKKAKARVGDWVRNKDGVVGVIISFSTEGKAQVRIPRGSEGVDQSGWRIIVTASEVDNNDPSNLLKNEMRILNSPEALKLFGTPTPEGQAARNNKICLCSLDQLTSDGKKFIIDRFNDAIYGRTEAKLLSMDKMGQVDYVLVKVGSDEDYNWTIYVEVNRDSDENVTSVKLLDQWYPADALADFAKFLTILSKEQK